MAHRIRFEPGEQQVAAFRRHWWLVLYPAFAVVPVLLAVPAYSTVDLALPHLRLAQDSPLFLLIDLVLAALIILKWLTVDLLAWWTNTWVLTNRRLIEQRGHLAIERREIPVLTVQESSTTSTGTAARFFQYGDLTIRAAGRDRPVCLQQIPHPQRAQRLIEAHARAARMQAGQAQGSAGEIQQALERIFHGGTAVHDTPTQVVPRITAMAARLQKQLQLHPDETVLYAGRCHPLVVAGTVVQTFVFGVLLIAVTRAVPVPWPLVWISAVFLACRTAWGIAGWHSAFSVVTTDRVILVRRRMLAMAIRTSLPLRAVSDVVLTLPSLAGRVFHVGSLTLEQDGQAVRLVNMPHPEILQHHILEQRDAVLRRDRLREQERMAGTLTEWFKEYHRMLGEAGGATP